MRVTVVPVLALVVLALAAPQGVAAGFGRCPKGPAVQANFTLEKYLGGWYEVARFNASFERDAFCVTANYSLNADKPGEVIVDNGEREGGITGKIKHAIGNAIVPNPKEPAKLAVKFPGAPVRGPYWVVHTDYTDITMIYSCSNFEVFHITYAWILARKPIESKDAIQALIAKYGSLTGVDTKDFYMTPQAGCTYTN